MQTPQAPWFLVGRLRPPNRSFLNERPLLVRLQTTTFLMLTGLSACAAGPDPSFYQTQCRTELIESLIFDEDNGRILTVAHRGAHDGVPENSIASIDRAVALGAVAVELDIRRSSDGVYILMHDSTLDRTTNASGATESFTLDQLQELRLRRYDDELTDQRIPTLAEALDVARGRIFVMLDSKVDSEADIAAIAELVNARNMGDQIIVYDYQPENLARYRSAIPGARAMVRNKDVSVIDAYVETHGPDIYHLEPDWNSMEIAARFDALSIPTWLNVFGDIEDAALSGDESELNRQLAFAPDLVQTDHPAFIIGQLSERGLHPTLLSDPSVPACD